MRKPRKFLAAAGLALSLAAASACSTESESAPDSTTAAAESAPESAAESSAADASANAADDVELFEAAEPPIPAGSAINITENVPPKGENFGYGACNVAFSFTLEDGRDIAVTSGHCGEKGYQVWASPSLDAEFDFGDGPIGEFIYTSFHEDTDVKTDVAFIELNDKARAADWVVAGKENGVPTAVASKIKQIPEELCMSGRTSSEQCGPLISNRLLSHLPAPEGSEQQSLKIWGVRAELCTLSGDSGGPVYGEVNGTPAIVGMVSGGPRPYESEEHMDCEQLKKESVRDVGTFFVNTNEAMKVVRKELGEPVGETL